MVSSVLVDALSDPTKTLVDLFDPTDSNGFPAKVTSHFANIFASKDAFSEIPSIYSVDPTQQDRPLVFFRAMVQDNSFSPEMYLAKRNNGECGGWGLGDDASGDVDYTNLRENTVVWAVNVPGESPWVASECDELATDSSSAHSVISATHPHKFPIQGAPHLGVQAKIYDSACAQQLKSTDIVTLVGLMTMEPCPCGRNRIFGRAAVVPTLHVLFIRPLAPTLIPRSYPFLSISNSQPLRQELIEWIGNEGLGGDLDAAEWVLLCIIARVQSRTPPLLPPSLVLSQFPAPNGSTGRPRLARILSNLVPLFLELDLSLDMLNTTAFYPESKNEDLHSGRLQVARGTTYLITESDVSEGAVLDRGLRNIRAVQDAMSTQTLDYVFPFSSFSFNTDLIFIVVSEGKKSAFFETHINVPLRPPSKASLYGDVTVMPSERSWPTSEAGSAERGLGM
ncbi:unnamed protein product [Mycena citricolor]|uniref:Uncharacterized protein n=1 Tax=Mycena citricolor TaxID=2018698 RepID=A0AAD2K501_9AGAR|nr:unnamed protein product [Mycena citricolor]